jgi:hypothetical protein
VSGRTTRSRSSHKPFLVGFLFLCALLGAGGAGADVREALPAWARDLAPLLWDGAEVTVDPTRSNVLEVDLGGVAVAAAAVQNAVRRLAVEEASTFRVTLLELVIRNGEVEGALELSAFAVPFALRFEDLEVSELRFRRMRFAQQVALIDVEVQRRFYADRSHFDDGLTVVSAASGPSGETKSSRRAAFLARPTGSLDSNLADPGIDYAFRIDKSEIENDLVLDGVQVRAGLALANNRIRPALRIADSMIHGPLEIRDNRLENLDLYTSTVAGRLRVQSNQTERIEIKRAALFGPFEISQNILLDYLEIGGAIFAPKMDGEDTSSLLQISENEIHKDLSLAVRYLSPLVDEIRLISNDVRGRASIEIPGERISVRELRSKASRSDHFRLNLQNSRFASDLSLAIASPVSEGDRCGAGARSLSALRRCARQVAGKLEQVGMTLGQIGHRIERLRLAEYCFLTHDEPGDRLLEVDFRSADVARLRWNLPIADCRYQWAGDGFRYRRWIGSSEEQERWISQILAPQPGPITFTAEQLRDAGNFKESRDLLFQAKRMNYEPRETGTFRTCTWDGSPLDPQSCLRQHLLYFYLYSSGFGVRPEYAGACLIVVWLAGLAFYYPYTLFRRWKDGATGHGWSWPGWLRRIDREEAAAERAGLHESAAPFRAAETAMSPGATETATAPPAGFALYQPKEPQQFSLAWFSLDATLPVIDLHAYNTYYPVAKPIRVVSFLQHILGWILVTSLLTSLAVL